MRSLLALLILSTCVIGALAQTSGCHVTVGSTKRDTTWTDGTKNFNIYDVTVTNAGTCKVTAVNFSIQPDHPNLSISQYWNLEAKTAPEYALANFGGTLYPGQSFGAGFIPAYTAPSTGVVTTTLISAVCEPGCGGGSTTGGTTGTTGGTTGTTGGTTGTTGGTTGTTGGTTGGGECDCEASAVLSARSASNGGSWIDSAGRPNQIYDVTIRNEGTTPITAIRLSFTPTNATAAFISQKWNLDENYNVSTYGPIPVSGGFGGAGVVLTGPGSLDVAIASKQCQCS